MLQVHNLFKREFIAILQKREKKNGFTLAFHYVNKTRIEKIL
jgi:plasmid replication initiation protein